MNKHLLHAVCSSSDWYGRSIAVEYSVIDILKNALNTVLVHLSVPIYQIHLVLKEFSMYIVSS